MKPYRTSNPTHGTVEWERGWRLSPKRWDSLRSIRCLLTGHRWHVNSRSTQRSCDRCWVVQDRIPRSES